MTALVLAATLIREFEGYRSEAYPDPASGGDPWTIGYGTTVYPNGQKVRWGDKTRPDEAEAWLQNDLLPRQEVVQQLVTMPLTDHQEAALVSFVYNLGEGNFRSSGLLRKLNAGDLAGAAEEFPKWNRGAGKVMAGLVRRRAAEKGLFETSYAKVAESV